jgi:hypothetical protein
MKAQAPPQPQTAGLPGVPWSPSEAAAINEFFNTAVGSKFINVLAFLKPKVSFENTERAALSGAYAAGYESVFYEIAKLRRGPPADIDVSRPGIDPTKD